MEPCGKPVDYDAELVRYREVLRRACDIHRSDRILDIGCGAGQTTRDAARLAVVGHAVGVDISEPMLQRARKLAESEQLHNVSFVQADAQVHPFPSDHFDVAISRFGTMFFADPIAAFANIGRALRPAGRLVMLVWQSGNEEEWFVSIQRALAMKETAPAAPSGTLNPFSLADTATTEHILMAAGFADVTFIDVREPVYYGANVEAALAWVCGFSNVEQALRTLDPLSRERALERLCRMFAAHDSSQGVWFDSRAWLVTARRNSAA
jgi:ubiquinone/menaquinone biosynthesis C-methylase UbiE